MNRLEHEKEVLGEIMLQHGIKWVDLDTHEKHKTVSRYKAEKLSEEIEQKTAQLDEVQQEPDKADKKKTKLTEIDSAAAGKTTSIYRHMFQQAQAKAGDAITSVLDFSGKKKKGA